MRYKWLYCLPFFLPFYSTMVFGSPLIQIGMNLERKVSRISSLATRIFHRQDSLVSSSAQAIVFRNKGQKYRFLSSTPAHEDANSEDTPMKYQNNIKQAYDCASVTYDNSVDMQKQVANNLIAYFDTPDIQKSFADLPKDASILEIGCGTGITTAPLLKYFPKATYTASDISGEMLAACEEKFGERINSYIEIDGENVPKDLHYTLVVSSLCFHWFKDIPRSIELLRHTSPFTVVTIPLTGSLEEWGELCKKSNITSRIIDFPSKDQIMSHLKTVEGAHITFIEDVIRQDFAQARGFLDFLKNIGSTHSPKPSNKRLDMSLLPIDEPFAVTYNIGYIFISWQHQAKINQTSRNPE